MKAREFWIQENYLQESYQRIATETEEYCDSIHVIEKTAYDSLVETLKDAMGMISSEYCSHKGECSSKVDECYVQKYHKVLEGY